MRRPKRRKPQLLPRRRRMLLLSKRKRKRCPLRRRKKQLQLRRRKRRHQWRRRKRQLKFSLELTLPVEKNHLDSKSWIKASKRHKNQNLLELLLTEKKIIHRNVNRHSERSRAS